MSSPLLIDVGNWFGWNIPQVLFNLLEFRQLQRLFFKVQVQANAGSQLLLFMGVQYRVLLDSQGMGKAPEIMP